MATTNIERFTADLRRFQDVVAQRGDLLVRGIAQELLNEVQVGTQTSSGKYSPGTPVDTGHARANWQGGINTAAMAEAPLPAAGTSPEALLKASQDRNTAVLAKAKLGTTVFLGNPVPYIWRLEYGFTGTDATGRYHVGFGPKSVNGRSRQAPNGFVRIALAAFQQIAEDVALGIRDTLPGRPA